MLGSCATHAAIQYYEALLNRWVDDAGPRRVVYVDGLPVTIATPRIAFSPTAEMWGNLTHFGTHTGEPDLESTGMICVNTNPPRSCMSDADCPPPAPMGEPRPCRIEGYYAVTRRLLPRVVEAYWPARERDRATVLAYTDNPDTAFCATVVPMFSAFCLAAGHPSAGVYLSIVLGKLKLVAQPLYRFGQRMLLAVTRQLQQRKHQGLEIRYSHVQHLPALRPETEEGPCH